MGYDSLLRVEKLENGYEVIIRDPEIEEKNSDQNSKKWEDPHKSYAFPDSAAVLKFIEKHLDSLKPPVSADEEYKAEFNRRTNSEE